MVSKQSRKAIAIGTALAFLTCAGFVFMRLASCERKYDLPTTAYKAPTFSNPRAPKYAP